MLHLSLELNVWKGSAESFPSLITQLLKNSVISFQKNTMEDLVGLVRYYGNVLP